LKIKATLVLVWESIVTIDYGETLYYCLNCGLSKRKLTDVDFLEFLPIGFEKIQASLVSDIHIINNAIPQTEYT